MLRTMLINMADETIASGDESLIEQYENQPNAWLWVDLDRQDRAWERNFLCERFNIDPLVIEDAQRERHPPKLEIFNEYFFLLLKGLDADTTDINFGVIQISFFVGKRLLITRRNAKSLSIDHIWVKLQKKRLDPQRGPAYITYAICRRIVDRYTPVVLSLEERLDEVESEMFLQTDDALLEELIANNSRLKKLRRILTYHTGLMQELASGTNPFVGIDESHAFNDAYTHFERLASLSNLYQELTMDLVNAYISLSSHRLNHIIKMLTMVTVIFLPLSLLAGIYGMNFEFIPELRWQFGYFLVLLAMGAVVLGSLFLFRKLRWL